VTRSRGPPSSQTNDCRCQAQDARAPLGTQRAKQPRERAHFMTTVETVRGAIETSALGTTLMHEHVFVLSPEVQQNYPAEWGSEEARAAAAIQKLRELKAMGVDTIVAPTVIGLGLYIPRIQRINEQVDINIVPATGLYTYDRLPFFFQHRGPAINPSAPDPLVDMF